VSAEVDVAATEGGNAGSATTFRRLSAEAAPAAQKSSLTLVSAALALPGVLPLAVAAQTAPDQSVIALKYFDYRDWQPGADRMSVRSPSLYVLRPLSDDLALEGTVVYDSMSGASPLAFNTLSGASGLGVTDYRTAGDVKVTKYFDRFALGVGGAYSHERDYVSRTLSLEARTWSADKNRTFAFGLAGTSDAIHPADRPIDNGDRQTLDFLVGVTQVLNANAILQSNVTYSTGHGFYSDPYKLLDRRPDHRRILAWLTRLNQYVSSADATLKLLYRYIHDSFGDQSHTFEAAWYQPLANAFAVTPSLRYYTQSAAYFYFGPPLGNGFVPDEPYTADTRLSGFGALTPAIRVDKQFDHGWSADISFSYYQQRPSWRLGGSGSPGLLPLSARWISIGVTKTF
jgi:Protein of unknown function (DUF3570)